MGESDEFAQLEDQADWERCNSYQRMFLALHDTHEGLSRRKKRAAQTNMQRVAEALLLIGARYRPRSERVRQAAEVQYEDLAHELHSRPVYTIFTLIARAIDERVEPYAPAGGGTIVVCQAIRREFPMAPADFRKVGKLEGRPNETGVPAASMPVKLLGILADLA